MGWAAFIDKLMINVCGLLLSVLMLKMIIMNLIELCSPRCSKPKIFAKGKQSVLEHTHKVEFRDVYDKDTDDLVGARKEHMDAELQTLMVPMPPNLVPQYTEIFM